MPRLLHFTRYNLIAIVAVRILTPLIDNRVEHLLVQYFLDVRNVVNIFDYTGGSLNSDLWIVWEEYGAVLAAYVVRKPGAATIAMTINGFGQFFIDGFQGPHIFCTVSQGWARMSSSAFFGIEGMTFGFLH